MDPHQYPRTGYATGPCLKDKNWGIAIVVLSALGVCCGLGVAGVGGVLGAAGAGIARQPGTNDPTPEVFAGIGGFVALVGFAIMACSAVQVAGGFGVMNGRRWGFVLSLVCAGLSILFHLPGVVHGTGVVGILINGFIAYYCWTRLSGKEGPVPV